MREKHPLRIRVRETQYGEETILKGCLGSTPDGRKVYVEFSPDSPLGRVFVEGDEGDASRIDFGKQSFMDGYESVGGFYAWQAVALAAEMLEKWERRVILAEASTSELLQALWNSLRIRGGGPNYG